LKEGRLKKILFAILYIIPLLSLANEGNKRGGEFFDEIRATYKNPIEREKALSFYEEYLKISDEIADKLKKRNLELEKINVGMVWERKNFHDKRALLRTLDEHDKFSKNQAEINKIYFDSKLTLKNKVLNSSLTNELKERLIFGFEEEMTSDLANLISGRQALFKELLLVNSEGLNLIKVNFGKVRLHNGSYVFEQENVMSRYEDLFYKAVEIFNKISEVYKKQKIMRD